MTTIIDATGLILGRMATDVAKRVLDGEDVHIVNAEKAIISGASKKSIQNRYTFMRDVGTHRKGPFYPREPHMIVKRTVRGMLQYQKPLGRAAYKRIRAHIGVPTELVGQPSITIDAAKRDPKTFMTVAELSTFLGRPTVPSAVPEGQPAPVSGGEQ